MSETDSLLKKNIDIENPNPIQDNEDNLNASELAKLDSLAASHYRQGKFLEASNLLKYVFIIILINNNNKIIIIF